MRSDFRADMNTFTRGGTLAQQSGLAVQHLELELLRAMRDVLVDVPGGTQAPPGA